MTLQHNLAKESGPSRPTVILKSVCHSCHGGCGVLLHVRDDVLLKIEGDPQSPLNHARLMRHSINLQLCLLSTVCVLLVASPVWG